MKSIIIKSIYFSLVILFIAGCGGSNNSEKSEHTSVEVPSTPIDVPASSVQSYYIDSQENISMATINIDESDITLHVGDQTLLGELKRSDKRKYYNQADQHHYSVKYKGLEGFKLRNANEEILWKIKIKDGKISIANNEEMNNAFDIRLYDDKRVKLKKGDEEIAAIRFDADNEFLKVGQQYFLRNFRHSMASGVLLIPGMNEVEKFVICAEILNMKK
ncbi:hypothetical protein [Fulvivirga sediminis]|uniref:Lipoprotein n=1 Tax=Fulvivirga sediminis TaxID=2803949 RepID=A0A937FAE9_9BACT|nr:hypothetical protein [Fulvivirga sediminis]MBL3657255.1 hypothetical protein [Fulvivirga sediminis]